MVNTPRTIPATFTLRGELYFKPHPDPAGHPPVVPGLDMAPLILNPGLLNATVRLPSGHTVRILEVRPDGDGYYLMVEADVTLSITVRIGSSP